MTNSVTSNTPILDQVVKKKRGRPVKDKSKCKRSYLYRIDDRANAGKVSALDAVNAEWRKVIAELGDQVWSEFVKGEFKSYLQGRVAEFNTLTDSSLQYSIKQCMCVSVEGALSSWSSNLANRVAGVVMQNKRYSGTEVQHELLWLNRMHLWTLPYAEQLLRLKEAKDAGATELKSISEKTSKLLRRYFSKYVTRNNKPNFDNLPLQMNQLSASLAPQASTTLSKVSYWLRIATLIRGSRVSLPIRHNPYADNIDGTLKKTFSFEKRNGIWYVKLVKELDIAEVRTTGVDVALDLGLRNRLATSNGVIYQVGFLAELEKWDARYIKIVQGLQNAGIRRLKDCARFRRFMRKFRSFLKSALLNSVNRVLATPWQTVVIERLSFFNTAGKLSRKFNRIVRQMGFGIIKNGLSQKAQLQGFTVADVNPAYSSQTCKCGFISHLNRNKDSFRCRSCGSSAHADVNASRILLERFKQSTPDKIHYKEVRLKGLDRWAMHIVAQLKGSPASSNKGVIGNARAGLTALINEKDKAIFALSSIKQLVSLLKFNIKANHSNLLNKIPTLDCT